MRDEADEMSKEKEPASILGGAFRLGLGSSLGTVVAAATTVLVASRLSPADWGEVATSASWALAVATLALFGLPQFATREIAAGRMSAAAAWGASATASLLSAPLTFVLLTVLGVPPVLSLLAGLLSVVVALRAGTAAPLVAGGRFLWLGAAAVVERLIALVVAVLVLQLGSPLLALFAAQCVGTGVVALRQATGVEPLRNVRPWSPSRYFRLLKENIAFGTNAVLFTVAQLDIVLVYALAGEQESGFFGVASRLILPLALVGTVVSTVLLPRLATTGEIAVPRRAAWLLLLALAAGLTAGVLLVNLVLVPVLGAAYAPSVRVCVVYLFAIGLVLVNQPLVAVAQGCGRERTAARLLVLHEIVHLGVAAVGALVYGAFGAAFGYLAGNLLLSTGLVTVFIFRERRVTWR